VRRFYLDRKIDATGVSGVGCIAQGVQFSDGTCALRWLTKHRSTAFYDSIESLEAIHGHGGATAIRWHDPREVP
jgi:hypothetical protein